MACAHMNAAAALAYSQRLIEKMRELEKRYDNDPLVARNSRKKYIILASSVTVAATYT